MQWGMSLGATGGTRAQLYETSDVCNHRYLVQFTVDNFTEYESNEARARIRMIIEQQQPSQGNVESRKVFSGAWCLQPDHN